MVAKYITILLLTIAVVGLFAFFKLRSNHYVVLARSFLQPRVEDLNPIDNRVNVVILGKGGMGHEAPELTDTIIFTSVRIDDPKVTLVSLPRDIWVPELRAKLNSAYYWGNQSQAGGGLALAKSTVEKIVGEPVSYAIVIDFSGFKEIIDILGGIDIYVDEGFTDEKYPIAGRENDICEGDNEFKCRFEKVEFKEGWQKMDGETALKFVRSRNAQGREGTDFARSVRQQKVIAAIKEKILSKETYLSFMKLKKLYETIRKSMVVDMTDEELAVLARLFFNARKNQISELLPEDLLVNPPIGQKYDYQYIFVPKNGNWEKVHEWIDSIRNQPN